MKKELEIENTNETITATPEPKIVTGYVINCGFLRVRKNPSLKSEVLRELIEGSKLSVDLTGSTKTFYRVLINGTEGFCLKDFIEV